MRYNNLHFMAGLRIHLLGAFEVIRDGHRLTNKEWRSRQNRTILKVLLTQGGNIVQSERLLELLWPGEDPQAARRNLHVRVSQLRQVLSPDDPTKYIQTIEGGYQFDLDTDTWIDVNAFLQYIEEGRDLQERGDLTGATRAYEKTRQLYRGDYLAEELYEDWAYPQRERLREVYLSSLTEAAECYAQQGRYRRAIGLCQQVIAIDPYREAGYTRLMLYYYYSGDQAQALRTYQRCREVLSRELEVDVLPQTTQLAEKIRQGTLWSDREAPHYPPPAYEGRIFEVPYSLGNPPLVGREREYAWLIEKCRGGRARMILLEGEAGVGKTRLAEELMGYLASCGETILRAHLSREACPPYAAIISALCSYPHFWEGERPSNATLRTLAPFFPEIREQFPHLPQPLELPPEHEKLRLHAAMEDLVRMKLPANTLVFIDDAHRLDEVSLEMLARLAPHLVILLTVRSESAPPGHPLRDAIASLRRRGMTAAMALSRLDHNAFNDLIREISRRGLDSIAEGLYEKTEGNPLFAIAALQHLFEEGLLYVEPGGLWAASQPEAELSLPPTVIETIEARLRGLNREQHSVFDIASVFGDQFDFSPLQHATGLEEEALLDALDGLLEAGLVIEPRAHGRAEFALGHGLYGEVAYQTLPQIRRRRYHQRVAEALQATSQDENACAAILAHHYREAGDRVNAFHWFVNAGDAARSRYAYREAMSLYAEAIDLDGGETAPVWERLGWIAHHLAQYEKSVDFYRKGLARWVSLQHLEKQAATHQALAESYREMSQFKQAAEHALQGLKFAQELRDNPELAARGHIIYSNALRSGQLAPATDIREHLEQALELARSVQARQILGEATFWLGVLSINAGDTQAALARDREALEHFQATGQTGWQTIAYNNFAYHSLLDGQPQLSLEMANKGLELAREIGSVNTEGWLLSTLGEALLHLGRLQEARERLEEGMGLVSRWGPDRLLPGFQADLAKVAMAEKRWQVAQEHLEAALASALQTAPQFVPRLNVYLAQVYQGVGHLETAGEKARQAQEQAHEKAQRSVEGQAWRALGQIFAAQGETTQAEWAFSRSLDLLEKIGDELEAARTCSAWGGWLEEYGEHRQAQGLLKKARQIFKRCGSALDLAAMKPDSDSSLKGVGDLRGL